MSGVRCLCGGPVHIVGDTGGDTARTVTLQCDDGHRLALQMRLRVVAAEQPRRMGRPPKWAA